MTQTDERPLVGDHPRFDQGTQVRRGWWWPIAAVGAVAVLAGFWIGRATHSSTTQEPTSPAEPGTGAEILDPGPLVAGIGGVNRYPTGDDDVERYNYAWPGQELVAPEPTTGDAVAWQWELCDVPPEPDPDEEVDPDAEPPPLECRAVDDATEEQWASPATNRTRLVRVIVTVDLGDNVRVRAATEPVAAVGWPEEIKPGDPPPPAYPRRATRPRLGA